MTLDPALIAAIAAAMIAGIVRGFSGFGGALIFMPVASALLDPKLAAVAFLVIDEVLTLPMAVKAIPLVRWRTVLPAAIAAMATIPFGAWLLAHGDPLTLRWAICAVVIALLVLLASGIRYHGEPHWAPSLGVGATSGVLGGVAQVSGPPVIVYWMSGPHAHNVIRANMFAYFMLMSGSTFLSYFWNGLFTAEAFRLILILGPAYALALFLGGRLFGRAASTAYRPIAYGVIALSALTSMPVFDAWLR